jgi:arsenate reductase
LFRCGAAAGAGLRAVTVLLFPGYGGPMLKFYGYKKCDTCRKAEKALAKLGQAYDFVDITEAPPSAAALKRMVMQSGAELKKFFNTSGVQYKELNIKDKVGGMSEAQILEMLAGNGRLLKRPLVTDGSKSTVGFDEAEFPKAWK